MRIIAADDEPLALEALVSGIKTVQPEAKVYDFLIPEDIIDFAKTHACDVAFLDIEMGTMSGLEVAKQLKQIYPKINIIFVTGYSDYMIKAFQMHASGYLLKPVVDSDIREELNNLRNPIMKSNSHVLTVRCFGTFDVFVDGKSIEFERNKTKELLAYLIDRRGSSVTSGELRAVLWEDAVTDQYTGTYLQKLKKDLVTSLKKVGLEDVFVTSWNKYAINPEYIACDYYDYLENKPSGIQLYNGEYMSQYTWATLKND